MQNKRYDQFHSTCLNEIQLIISYPHFNKNIINKIPITTNATITHTPEKKRKKL